MSSNHSIRILKNFQKNNVDKKQLKSNSFVKTYSNLNIIEGSES